MSDIVSVEALRAQESGEAFRWIMKSSRRFKILNQDGGVIQSIALESLELYTIQRVDGMSQFTLFVEPLSSDRKQYKGYILRGESAKLIVGREDSKHICYTNRCVSGSHAELEISVNEMMLGSKPLFFN